MNKSNLKTKTHKLQNIHTIYMPLHLEQNFKSLISDPFSKKKEKKIRMPFSQFCVEILTF